MQVYGQFLSLLICRAALAEGPAQMNKAIMGECGPADMRQQAIKNFACDSQYFELSPITGGQPVDCGME